MARGRLAANASEFEASEEIKAAFASLNERIRALESGAGRGPGSSFALPLLLVGATGHWTIREVAGSLLVTSPGGTNTTIGNP